MTDENESDAVAEYVQAFHNVLNEVAYYLDGLTLEPETEAEIDEILDCIEDKLCQLHQLAEDCFNAANAQA